MDQDPAAAYLAAHVLTAPPGEQLLLAYSVALQEVDRAREAWVRGDIDAARSAEAKLTRLLLLLLGAVNPEPDPVLAGRLVTLYQWCLARLGEGPSTRLETYDKVRTVLAGLHEAFAQAARRGDRG